MEKNTIKVLCVCNHGNVRSASLARILKDKGYQAIAIGAEFSTKETMGILANWSDKIIWMSEKFIISDFFSLEMNPNIMKIIMIKMGEDIWHNPFHPNLMKILNKYLKEQLEKFINLKESVNKDDK